MSKLNILLSALFAGIIFSCSSVEQPDLPPLDGGVDGSSSSGASSNSGGGGSSESQLGTSSSSSEGNCGEGKRFHIDRCKSEFEDGRDGKRYVYVTIGERIWMAENLNYNTESGSWCYGDNTGGDSQNRCGTYGRLYNLDATKTVCPFGWHLPSDDEWTMLTNHVGSDAGTKLKAKSGWNDGGNGTDNHGFAALPGGYGFPLSGGSTFAIVGTGGSWWSGTQNDASYAYYRVMYGNSSNVTSYDDGENGYYSVRCVQN
jgi:uncharacterized protein (TIGR02145 family)